MLDKNATFGDKMTAAFMPETNALVMPFKQILFLIEAVNYGLQTIKHGFATLSSEALKKIPDWLWSLPPLNKYDKNKITNFF